MHEESQTLDSPLCPAAADADWQEIYTILPRASKNEVRQALIHARDEEKADVAQYRSKWMARSRGQTHGFPDFAIPEIRISGFPGIWDRYSGNLDLGPGGRRGGWESGEGGSLCLYCD